MTESSAPVLPIRTDRLVLRPYRPEDVEATLAYYGDPEVSRFLLSEPFTRPDAERAVTERVRRTDPREAGDKLALVVEHQDRPVGDLVLELKGDPVSVAEIGWVFDPRSGDRGLATEAARAVIDLAFRHYAVHRVVAQLDARNVASVRMCERLGMVREAHLRQDWYSKGEWTDTLVYGLLADDRRVSGDHADPACEASRIKPVGTVRTDRTDPAYTDHWGAVVSTIEVDHRFPDDCLLGLDHFSHVEVVFGFDRADERDDYTARRPRGRDDLPAVGIFCDRGPRRPNRLGVTACEVVAVRGRRLTVRGLDAVDGTPVVDIKPVLRQFLPRGEFRQPEWVDRLMAEYHRP